MVTDQEKSRLHIVFDFDGTLADSFQLALSVWNQIAGPAGLRIVYPEAGFRLRGLPAGAVLQELGVAWHQIPRLIGPAKRQFGARIDEISPFPQIAEMLPALVEQGNSLHVVTSNSVENVEKFLKRNELEFFESIHSASAFFGKGRLLKQLRRSFKDVPMVYVGDEVRDVEAARSANIPVVAVTWGYNTAALLAQAHPDQLAAEPRMLVDIFRSGFTRKK